MEPVELIRLLCTVVCFGCLGVVVWELCAGSLRLGDTAIVSSYFGNVLNVLCG